MRKAAGGVSTVVVTPAIGERRTTVRIAQDDQGTTVSLPDAVSRVVSLVPSLTESVAATSPGVLIGATEWCTHPAELDVCRVRGTKNPDVDRIISLRPDLVLCNKEENRERDVQRLRAAGLAVWVTVIETLDEAFTSLGRMFDDALGVPRPGWLNEAVTAWGEEPAAADRVPVVVPIWRDPWMVVGSSTFTGSLLDRLGAQNIFGQHAGRYPRLELDELVEAATRSSAVVLLPDEPYTFTSEDGPEVFGANRVELVSGRLLTWYGPSLAMARPELDAALRTERRR